MEEFKIIAKINNADPSDFNALVYDGALFGALLQFEI